MRKVLFPTKFIKTKIKKIVAIFFFLLISNISYCDTNFIKSLPEEIIIKQSPNDHIKFKKNLFRAFIDGDTKKKNNIKKKYKKWHGARLSTNNSNEVDVKIRLMGDWKDHIKLPKSSLKVKVEDNNNISGFRYFRLYLPNTRNRNNEIFITTILRHLDFPSYYTFNVNVNFNGNRYQAIMQEDASKEFLERSGIPELPIIKTDEYTFYLDKVSNEYYQNQKIKNSYILYNQNFLKKNHSTKIVSDAINLMHSLDFKKMVYRNNFFETIMKKYAPHGMVEHNRRYIYVPFSNIFIPLYYDGDVNFQNIKTDNCKLLENLEEKFKRFEDEYYLLLKNKLTKKMQCVAIDIFKKYELHKTHKIMTVNSNYNLKLKFTNEFEELRKLIFSYLNINKGNIDYENDQNLDLGYSYTFFINKNYFRCYLKLKNLK